MLIGTIIYQIVVFLLLLLFFASMFLFVRSLLRNQSGKSSSMKRIEEKLDKIIENQEKQLKN
jgi:hypothetical protein